MDLVISDLGLPDGDGDELRSTLRRHLGVNGIALTGYGREADVARSQAAGFVTHLAKPVSVQTLKAGLAAARFTHKGASEGELTTGSRSGAAALLALWTGRSGLSPRHPLSFGSV